MNNWKRIHLTWILMVPLLAHAVPTGPLPALPPVPTPSTESTAIQPTAMMQSSASVATFATTGSSLATASSSSIAPVRNCTNITKRRAEVDSLFALGSWKELIPLADGLCPCAPVRARITCRIQAIRALAQKDSTLPDAIQRLDELAISAEPEDAGYSEMMLLQTSLMIQMQQPARALKSWKLAKQTSTVAQEVELKALCTQLRTQFKDTTLSRDCNKIPALTKILVSLIPSQSSSSATPSSSSTPSQLSTPPSAAEGSWVLQFGAFSNRDNADLLIKNLKSRKVSSRMITKNTASRVLWLVQTEPFETKEAAQDYERNTLDPLGLDPQLLKIQ